MGANPYHILYQLLLMELLLLLSRFKHLYYHNIPSSVTFHHSHPDFKTDFLTQLFLTVYSLSN